MLAVTVAIAVVLPAHAADQAPDGQRPAPAPTTCTADEVMNAVGGLYPPASAEVRADSARTLARCRDPRSVGPAGAALAQDPAIGVRVEAARALGSIGDRAAQLLLESALAGAAPLLVKQAVAEALVASGNDAAVVTLLRDRRAPDALRASALRALARRRTAARELAAESERLPPGAAGPPAPATAEGATPDPEDASLLPPAAAAPATAEPLPPAPLPFTLRPPLPPPPPPPYVPWNRRDGGALAVTTSIVAGAVWGSSLSLLSQQDGVGVVTLLGSAGAVIGGGTAWGLTRFGMRPSAAQALWFANSTAWGTLAGLTIWSGSGVSSDKLKYGLLVGGQTAGIIAGALTARRFDFSPAQTLMADRLVLGAGLGLAGTAMILDPEGPWDVPPAAAYGVVPTLLGAAVASRYLRVGPGDLRLLVTLPLAAGWTGALLASGGSGESLLESTRSGGGMLLGLGAGYLGAMTAASFVEVRERRLGYGAGGMLAGNGLGLGLHMVLDPRSSAHWPLGAGLGGLGLGLAGLAVEPHLQPGPRATSMTIAGALHGSLPWALASSAASTGQAADARLPGGMLAGAVAAGLTGLVASQHFQPDGEDQAIVAGGSALGMGAGLGIAKLTTTDKGLPEFAGVLAGAAAGVAGGITVARGPRLRPPALLAGVTGGGYGLLVGSLLPTIDDPWWSEGRRTAGAQWLGLSLGTAGATLLTQRTSLTSGGVLVTTSAGTLGLGMGVGAGAMWPGEGTRGKRIGALAGSTVLLGAGLLAEQRLRLSETLGPHALAVGTFGMGAGAAHGLLVGRLVQANEGDALASRQRGGAVLFGASAGLASGLLVSRWIRPDFRDYLAVTGASVLGHSAGLGLFRLTMDDDRGTPDRRQPALQLFGAMAGLAGGAYVAGATRLEGNDLVAGGLGAAYGAAVGAVLPSLDEERLSDDRQAEGGAHLGLALGGIGAATAAHLTRATSAEIAVPTTAATLGAMAGLGLASALPEESGQRQRAFAVTGSIGLGAASLALMKPFRLDHGFAVPGSAGLTVVGAAVGGAQGAMLAGLLDESGLVGETPEDRVDGGLMFGTVMGASAGYLLARPLEPSAADSVIALGGSFAGGTIGVGVSMLVTDQAGRPDTAAAMAGSLAGLGLAALTQRHAPLQDHDFVALPVGAAFGGLLGWLGPGLDQQTLSGIDRDEQGGLLAGLAGGAVSAMALRHATDASPGTVGLAALGGADGMLTGLGIGLLVDDAGSSQAQRLGVVAGGVAGLGVGASLWPRLNPQGTDPALIGGLSALGTWYGLWSPLLGHAAGSTVDEQHVAGGALAGAGAASLLATGLVPVLDLDPDLLGDALVMDALFTGAGAGVGALASSRMDAPVWGMLGAGTAGLVLGAGLHRSIDFGPQVRPLLTLSLIEGAWAGAWLPYALHRSDQVTARQRAGALAAGTLGGAGLALLAGPLIAPSSQTTAGAGIGSAIGAALTGGAALIASPEDGRRGVGLMLGGTGVGLLAGTLAAPRIDLRAGAAYGTLGATLGASEGLVFAWAGRADGSSDYGGAALVGAGVGSTLGLVAAAYPGWMSGRGLPAAGFAGWGAWMGAFGGALINRDPHEVTLGGLGGANLGLAAGWGLLSTEIVQPRDFGWLSAFGAAGTVVGGGVGALFSKRDDPRPALAGLLIGPAVGLATGAVILPRLRTIGGHPTAWRAKEPGPALGSRGRSRHGRPTRPSPGRSPATDIDLPLSEPHPPSSTDVLAARQAPGALARFAQRARGSFRFSQVMPVLGGLPAASDSRTGPAPFLLGLAGLWD
jgi:hypothetical protein